MVIPNRIKILGLLAAMGSMALPVAAAQAAAANQAHAKTTTKTTATPTAAGAASAPSAPATSAALDTYRGLAAADRRVNAIGYRLASSARDWCSDTVPSLGWLLTDRAQYPAQDQRAAAMAYNTLWPESPDIIIAAIAPGSPAARAGFHVGEAVIAIDDQNLDELAATAGDNKKKSGTFSRMGLVEQGMTRWLADGVAEVRVQNALHQGQGLSLQATLPVKAQPVCATRFSVTADDEMNAAADGERVQVTASLVEYATRDDELAAVIAHEFAHNILKHRLALNAAGISRGLFQQFGRNARLTRQSEDEADQLSVWLLAKAGYDPYAAARMWERFGPEHDGGILRSKTHGSWKARRDAMMREADSVSRAFAANPSVRPALVTRIPPKTKGATP